MEKYTMSMSKKDVMGEGSSSVCRMGLRNADREKVAIKTYKTRDDSTMMKFSRQISVLEELQKPFQHVPGALWNEQLMQIPPSNLFMRLIDYSKDAKGMPGPDPIDGEMYVVTEVGEQSLKDYIKQRRDDHRPLSKGCVKSITKAMVRVTAGLHAKGFVHLDLKPENLMIFNGRLKLIDVDGCVKSGAEVSIDDFIIFFTSVLRARVGEISR
jgi:serine/threonine protein kinase